MSFKKIAASYKKIMSAKGLTIRDEIIYSIKDNLSNSFEDNPNYYLIEYQNKNTGIYNDIGANIFKAKNTINSGIQDDFRKIVLNDYNLTISLGDIFRFEGYVWIVINTDNISSVINNFVVRRVNYNLEWKNAEGTIITQPVIFDYFKFTNTANLEETKELRIGDTYRYITMQKNNNSILLHRDKRFIIDGIAYKVVNHDSITMNGLYLLTLEEHQINTSTDLVREDGTGIANYYGNLNYTINILTDNISFSIGDNTQLNTEVKVDGVIVSNSDITYVSSNENIATVSSTGLVTAINNGNCIISAYLTSNSSIFDTCNIEVVSSPVSNIVEQIEGSDNIKVGLSESYEIYKLDNGVSDGSTYTFSLNNNLATLSNITLNTVKVVARTNIGIVILLAQNNTTNEIFTKTIYIESLW